VLREFRDTGMSEWLALMHGFGWSASLPETNQFGVVLSWTTSAAVGCGNGWSAAELAAIEELSGTLALRSRAIAHLWQRTTCSRPMSAATRRTASVRDKCSAAQSAASLPPFSLPTCAALPTSPRRQRPRRACGVLTGSWTVWTSRCARRAAKSSSFSATAYWRVPAARRRKRSRRDARGAGGGARNIGAGRGAQRHRDGGRQSGAAAE